MPNDRIFLLQMLGISYKSIDYHLFYQLTSKQFRNSQKGKSLLRKYGNILHLLQNVFPEYSWLPWKMKSLPKKYYVSLEHQRKYFDWLKDQLQITSPEQWTNIHTREVVKYYNAGKVIFNRYSSLHDALRNVYPEINWNSFIKEAKTKNPKLFLKEFELKNNIKCIEDWYKIKNQDIINEGGNGLLNQFGGSLLKMLQHYYPEEDWRGYKFNIARKDSWGDREEVRLFLDELKIKLSIVHPEDWQRVSTIQFREYGGQGLLQVYGSIEKCLQKAYPEYNWSSQNLSFKGKKATQRWLYLMIKKMLNEETFVIENYKFQE